MANDAEILRSYLTSIGFEIDEDGYRKFKNSLVDTSKRVTELSEKLEEMAVVAVGVATELSASVMKIATSMDRLYFTSQRTGASTKNIQALQFGAEKVGVSAEEATAALENMSQALRVNPAMVGLLRQMGLDPREDKVKLMLDLIEKLGKFGKPGQPGYFMGKNYAEMFGIDERTYLMMLSHLKELREAMEQNKKTNPIDENAVKQFHDFMNDVRDLRGHLEQLANVAGARLLPVAKELVHYLDQGVQLLLRMDKATDGWSTRLLTLVGSIGSVVGGLKLLKSILGVLGLGGAGEAAAGGAATAGGIGLGGAALIGTATVGSGIAAFDIYDALKHQNNLTDEQKNERQRKRLELAKRYGMDTSLFEKPPDDDSKLDTRSLIIKTAKELGIDPALALAQAHQESNFNQNAVSNKGAIGVMQLMPDTAKRLGVDPHNREENVRGGLTYLKALLQEFLGNEMLALAAYDYGPGRVAQLGRVPNFPETQDYVKKIEAYKLGEQKNLGIGEGSTSTPVSIQQHTEINVDGATNPQDTANKVAAQQRQVNQDLIRNATSTVR